MCNARSISFFLVLAFASVAGPAALAAEFDVLVNPSVKEASISKADVKQIFLTNKTTWKDGSKITIVGLSPDAPGTDEAAQEYMNMTGTQAKKFWLTKVFNGVLSAQPPLGDSADEVAEKVGGTAGAIGVVPKGTKPGKAKILPQN